MKTATITRSIHSNVNARTNNNTANTTKRNTWELYVSIAILAALVGGMFILGSLGYIKAC